MARIEVVVCDTCEKQINGKHFTVELFWDTSKCPIECRTYQDNKKGELCFDCAQTFMNAMRDLLPYADQRTLAKAYIPNAVVV